MEKYVTVKYKGARGAEMTYNDQGYISHKVGNGVLTITLKRSVRVFNLKRVIFFEVKNNY